MEEPGLPAPARAPRGRRRENSRRPRAARRSAAGGAQEAAQGALVEALTLVEALEMSDEERRGAARSGGSVGPSTAGGATPGCSRTSGAGTSRGPPRRAQPRRGRPVRRHDSPRDAQDRGPFHRATLRALERRGRRPNDRPPLARRPRHECEGAEEHRPVGQPLPASPSRRPWRARRGTPDPRCFPTAEASTGLTRGVLPTGDMDRSRTLGLRFVSRRTRLIPFLALAASMRPSSAAPRRLRAVDHRTAHGVGNGLTVR